jgi:hypothetical protein
MQAPARRRVSGFRRSADVERAIRGPVARAPELWVRRCGAVGSALDAIHRLLERPSAKGEVLGRLEQMSDLVTTVESLAT